MFILGHTDAVLGVVFSPNGRQAASASGTSSIDRSLIVGDTTVRVWDLTTETPQHTLAGHKNWVLCIAWSPDGRFLASGGMDNVVIVWDAKTGQAHSILRGHSKWITSLSWEPFHK